MHICYYDEYSFAEMNELNSNARLLVSFFFYCFQVPTKIKDAYIGFLLFFFFTFFTLYFFLLFYFHAWNNLQSRARVGNWYGWSSYALESFSDERGAGGSVVREFARSRRPASLSHGAGLSSSRDLFLFSSLSKDNPANRPRRDGIGWDNCGWLHARARGHWGRRVGDGRLLRASAREVRST